MSEYEYARARGMIPVAGHGEDPHSFPQHRRPAYDAAVRGEAGEGQVAPYPTRAQARDVERRFEQWKKDNPDPRDEHGNPAPPAPRQPVTMLDAIQRAGMDLRPESLLEILSQIQPRAPLEQRHLTVISSSTRDDPEHTSSNDFTVTFPPSMVPQRVHGFRLTGYTLPRSEWIIRPDETGIPFRFGWSGTPGSRAFAIIARTITKAAQPAGSFAFTGRAALTCELPLVCNPIVRIQVFVQGGTKVVRAWCARRVGTAIWTVAARDANAVVLNSVGHPVTGHYPGNYALSGSSLARSAQTSYAVAGTSSLPVGAEEIMGALERYDEAAQGAADSHAIDVVDTEFTQYFTSGTEARAWNQPLGFLFAKPPPTAASLAAQMTQQFGDLVRRFNASVGTADGAEIMPIQDVRIEWRSAARRFELTAQWGFDTLLPTLNVPAWFRSMVRGGSHAETLLPALLPVAGSTSDGLLERFGLPSCTQVTTLIDKEATYLSRDAARMYAQDTVDAAPTPSGDDAAFWTSLNTASLSVEFRAQDTSKTSFYVPFRVPNGVTSVIVNAEVTNGEYSPWGLAVAITEAIRAHASLSAYRIVVTPVFLQFAGNALAGFRIESIAPIPIPFELAFDQYSSSSTTNQVLNPSKLGFRNLAYAGRTVYTPHVLGDPFLGFSTPIAFPATEVGTGVPAPLPCVPFVTPCFSNRRLEISQLAYGPAAISDVTPPEPLVRDPVVLFSAQARRFYQHQHVRINVNIPASSILFSGVVGGEEVSGGATTGDLFVGSEEKAGDDDDPFAVGPSAMMAGSMDSFLPPTLRANELSDINGADILTVFKNMHDPNVGGTSGIAFDLVKLFGSAARTYGSTDAISPGASDGPYRQFVVSVGGSLARVDDLLTNLADQKRVRLSFLELFQMMRVIRMAGNAPIVGPGDAEALHNVVAAYDDAVKPPDFDREFLLDLANTYAHNFTSQSYTAITIDIDGNVTDPGGFARMTPNELVRLTFPTGAAIDVSQNGLSIARVISASQVEFKPTSETDTVTVTISGTEADLNVRNYFVTMSGSGYAFRAVDDHNVDLAPLITGETYWFTVSGAAAQDEIKTTELTSIGGVRSFSFPSPTTLKLTVAHNVDTVSVSATDISAADSAETTLAKMYLIANGYSMSIPGRVLMDLSGTNRFPFDIEDALDDLGIVYSSDAQAVEDLLDALDPGVVQTQRLRVVVGSTSKGAWGTDLSGADPTSVDEIDTQLVFLQTIGMAADASLSSVNVTRNIELPMSLDFASRVPRMMHPEVLGFQFYEYSADSGEMLGSVIDINRTGPKYVMLYVELNATPTPAPASMRPDGFDSSFLQTGEARPESTLLDSGNGTVTALADPRTSDYPQRLVLRATAVVPLGDGLTVLDRQDDREPVLFPTSMQPRNVRVRVTRPDGTPYGLGGAEATVLLRLFSQSENPAWMPGSGGGRS